MLTEKAAKRKRRNAWYVVFACLAAAFAAFLLFLSSPLAVHTVWLPICSALTGIEMSADSARVHFFSKKDNVFLKNFRAFSPGGNAISITELRCSADLPALLTGKVIVDDVYAKDGHCTMIPAMAIDDDDEIVRNTDVIKLGSVMLENVEVSCRRPAMMDGYDLHIDRFFLSGLAPDARQMFSSDGTFSVTTAPSSTIKAPFSVRASYFLNRDFSLREFMGQMSSENAVCTVDGDTKSLIFAGTANLMRYDEDFLKIKEISVSMAAPDGTAVVGVLFSGDLNEKCGELKGAAALSSHGMKLAVLPEVFGVKISSEEGEIDYSADIKINNEVFEWNGSGTASAEKLFFGGEDHALNSLEAYFSFCGSLDFLDDTLCIHDTSLDLFAGGRKKISVSLSRDSITIAKKASGVDVFGGKDGKGSPYVEMMFADVGLSCLSPFLADTDISHGSFTSRMVFDDENGILNGSIEGAVKEFSHVSMGAKTRKHDIIFKAGISSENSSGKKVYSIKDFVVTTSTPEFGTAVTSVYSGRYMPSYDIINLDGRSTLHPWAFTGLFDEQGADDFRQWLEKTGLKDTECVWNVKTGYSVPDGDLTLAAESRIDDLSDFNQEFSGTGLVMRLAGSIHAGRNAGRIRVSEFAIEAGDLFDFNSSLLARFPERTLDFDFSMKRLSSRLVRNLAKSFETDSRAVKAISNQISFENISVSGDGNLDGRSSRLTINDFSLELLAAAGGKATFTLTSPVKGSFANGKYADASARVVCDQLDLREINMLVPGYDPFRFLSGKANAGFDVVLKDALREMDFTYKISAEAVVCGMYDMAFDFGESHLSGGLVLSDYFRNLELVSVEVVCDDGGEIGLNMTTNGFLSFTGDCHSRLEFEFTRLNRPFLRTIINNIDDLVHTENFDGTGRLVIGCEDGFDTVTADAKIDVRELLFRLPSGGRRPLNGTFNLSLDDFLHDTVVDDISLALSDANGRKVLDATLKGKFSDVRPEKEAKTFLTVRTADAEFFHLAGIAAGSIPDATTSFASGFNGRFVKARSQALTIGRYYTDMSISLDNVTYSEDLTCQLYGDLSWHDGTMKFASASGNVNSSPLTFSFIADTGGKKVEPFTFDASLEELDLGKVSDALGSTVGGMEDGISGKLVRASVSGEVKRSKERVGEEDSFVKAKGELKDVVLPRSSQSEVVNIVLLPVSSIPKLISLIQDDVIRDFLKKNMGDKISVVTGKKDVMFNYGEFLLEAENSQWQVKKCRLLGPDVDVRVLPNSCFNVQDDTIDVRTETIFAAVEYPAEYTGKLSDPSLNVPYFLYFFFQDNTFRIINGTVSLITLGLVDARNDWTVPPKEDAPAEASGK